MGTISVPGGNGHDQRVTRDRDESNRHAPRRYRRSKRRHGNCYVKRYWRTRKDPFADVWKEIQEQLEQAPDLLPKALFKALQHKYPWKFKDGQL